MKDLKQQLEIIKRGAVEIIQQDELKVRIEKSIKSKKPLIIKAGFDPTVPDIHLGHTVLLRKLRHFQDCGHKIIFLIGDATALIGDPSGQSKTRKTLHWDEIEKNAKTYVKQVSSILITGNDKLFELRRNRKWFDVPHFFDSFVELAQRYTVARLLERDDFQKRIKENKPISFLELFYPLMQGYDSVELKADVEIGGTDQKFNMLVGRNLQQVYNQSPQVVITMPLLVGTDGINKMSKSLGNYIGISEKPDEIFGKIMSISDELMYSYYELLSDEDFAAIKESVKEGGLHPKKAKENLAEAIIGQYYNKKTALDANRRFEEVFTRKMAPEDLTLVKLELNQIDIFSLIKNTNLVPSSAQIKRLLAQGAVSVDNKKITDPAAQVSINEKGVILKIGKRQFVKVIKA